MMEMLSFTIGPSIWRVFRRDLNICGPVTSSSETDKDAKAVLRQLMIRFSTIPRSHLKVMVFLCAIVVITTSWVIVPDRFFQFTSWDYDNGYGPIAATILARHPFIWIAPRSPIKAPPNSPMLHLAPGSPLVRFPAGYPLLIAATRTVAGFLEISEAHGIEILNLAAIGISAMCLFSIASTVFGNLPGMIAPLLWVAYPGLLVVSRQPAPEIPFCALVFAALDLFWYALRPLRYQLIKFFCVGLLLGGAMLVRAQGIGFGIVLALFLLFFVRELPRRLRLTLMAMLLAGNLLAILPWEAWIYTTTGAIVPLCTSGSWSVCDGLTFAVNPDAAGRQNVTLPGDLKTLSLAFLAQCRAGGSTAARVSFIATRFWSRPVVVTEFVLLKAVRSWYATNSGRMDRYVLGPQILYFTLFVWTAAISMRRAGQQRLLALVVLSLVIYTWAETIAVLSILRYMLPAVGLLFVLSPAAVCQQSWTAIEKESARHGMRRTRSWSSQ